MSVVKDVVAAMKEVLMLTEKVDQTGKILSEISKELRDHDRRIVRLETFVEIGKMQHKQLP
jgi:hypothetical protein